MTDKLNKKFPEGSVCKPCWELKYCPYGDITEWFPLIGDKTDLEEIKKSFDDCLKNFFNANFKTKDDVWNEINRFLFLIPSHWEFYSQFPPEEISCKMRGHACPVFFYQHGQTETKEYRRESRNIPRNIMLKVVRRDNQRCQMCNKYVPDNEIEFDHIIPFSKGGPTTTENIRILCRSCNRKKSDSLKEILEE